jgi:GntR family transcriptional regulator
MDSQADSTATIPLYYRVYSVLRQRIMDGVYPAGGQLAAETDLAVEFAVSRATIRQAVGQLVSAGLVSRQQGRGTFVLEHAAQRLSVTRFRGDLEQLIGAAAQPTRKLRVLEVAHDQPLPEAVARSLGLDHPRGTIARRVMTVADRAFAFHVNYLPPDLGALLTRTKLRGGGVMFVLQREGIELVRARQTICARPADPVVARELDVVLGSAVLVAERLLVGADDRPLELARSTYPGDTYEYVVDFERGVDGRLA